MQLKIPFYNVLMEKWALAIKGSWGWLFKWDDEVSDIWLIVVLTVFRYLINCCNDCCLHLEHWPKKKLPWTEAREKLGSYRELLDIVLIKFWSWGPREMVDSPLIRKTFAYGVWSGLDWTRGWIESSLASWKGRVLGCYWAFCGSRNWWACWLSFLPRWPSCSFYWRIN